MLINQYWEEPSANPKYRPCNDPLGITLAPTGMLPVKPYMTGNIKTDYVPIFPNEIIETVHNCYELGVGSVHLHARKKNGQPSQDPEDYEILVEKIRAYCPEIIIGVTTSGRNNNNFEGRSKVLFVHGIDMASLTINSIQFPTGTVVAEHQTIMKLIKTMHEQHITPEFEFFDYGGINFFKYLYSKGIVNTNTICCNILLGNIASNQPLFIDMVRMIKMINMISDNSYIAITGIGRFQLKMQIASMIHGNTHIRVGLEDNIFFDAQRTIFATNEMLVKRLLKIAEIIERPIATAKEMRNLMKM